jgi:hypothetical protein
LSATHVFNLPARRSNAWPSLSRAITVIYKCLSDFGEEFTMNQLELYPGRADEEGVDLRSESLRNFKSDILSTGGPC